MNKQTRKIVAIGEVMVEMAPVGEGLYRRGFAGDSFNTIWHMAQLLRGRGIKAGLVTRLGQDGLSRALLAELQADGLDNSGISLDPIRQIGLYLIELQGVERHFHYWRSSSAARGLADDRTVLAEAVSGAGLIHLSGITLAILSSTARQTLLSVLQAAREAGACIVFDPNIRPALWASPTEIRAAMQEMMAVTDIALPSFDDEARLWGDATPLITLERFSASGVGEVIVKDGCNPVHALVDTAHLVVETPAVKDIRDTSGAGDAFNAGYLSARLLGHGGAFAIVAGQALAAEVIKTLGARADKNQIPHLAAAINL